MKLKIKNAELVSDIAGKVNEFPKYTTQLINLSNQNAQGTRPKVVGQMSDLIQEFEGNRYEDWAVWYQNKKPTAIKDATEKIYSMVLNLQKAIGLIDKHMVEKWVKDLVLNKTFIGLRFQESILKKVASLKNESYRLAIPEEESNGIDGYIGDKEVSIKPITYKTKNMLNEQIDIDIIYYDKKKDGINIEFDF
ncbi:MAG: MjaI family restriction endonuclease [Actinobacteria bacterium]|nr:MjaI family restriction endonuclease [Actinomycetota bacterium]